MDEPADLLGPGHVADLEVPGADRPVPERAPEQRPLDLDGADPREPNRRRAPPDDAVHDEELLARHDDVRAIPAPDRGERDDRRDDEQDTSRRRRGPTDSEEDDPGGGGNRSLEERTDEHDAMPTRVEEDALLIRELHLVCELRRAARNPWSWDKLRAAPRSRRSSQARSSSRRSRSGSSSSSWR